MSEVIQFGDREKKDSPILGSHYFTVHEHADNTSTVIITHSSGEDIVLEDALTAARRIVRFVLEDRKQVSLIVELDLANDGGINCVWDADKMQSPFITARWLYDQVRFAFWDSFTRGPIPMPAPPEWLSRICFRPLWWASRLIQMTHRLRGGAAAQRPARTLLEEPREAQVVPLRPDA